ncbi:MAG: MarR family winged helix-turn-helix transcriptional regulator [Thermoanaerobaculia bacterium]
MKDRNLNVENKIAELLDRYCRIFKMMQWETAKKFKLSPLQSQFLIYLKEYPKEFCTTLNLSKEFGISPPTASDSLKVLEKKGLIEKEKNSKDKRNHYIILTAKGATLLEEIKKWDRNFHKSIKFLGDEEKNKLLELLFKLLINLQSTGLVLQLHACITCKSFVIKNNKKDKEYYCALTKKKLEPSNIKFNCKFYLREKGLNEQK